MSTFRSHIIRAIAATTIILAGFAAELSLPALRSLATQHEATMVLVQSLPTSFEDATVQAANTQQRAYSRPRNANARATIRAF